MLFSGNMRRGFEQESRHTLSKHATEFKTKVKFPFEESQHERSSVIHTIASYHVSLHFNLGGSERIY